MKLISYRYEEELRVGILAPDELAVLPLEAVLPETAGLSMLEVIEIFPEGLPLEAEDLEEAMAEEGGGATSTAEKSGASGTRATSGSSRRGSAAMSSFAKREAISRSSARGVHGSGADSSNRS